MESAEIDTLLDRIVSICEDAIGTRGKELDIDLRTVKQYLERIESLNDRRLEYETIRT